MHLDAFDYFLPPWLIAAEPRPRRDHSRLLVLRRGDGSLSHHRFDGLPALLEPGDLLVANDTRVLPARLLGRRANTGGKWEGLFLRERPGGLWELLGQTRGRLAVGERLLIDPPAEGEPLALELREKIAGGRWTARPVVPPGAADTRSLLERFGHIPLPPYIRKQRALRAGEAEELPERPEDRERYQTVYAREPGSVAAPTAGLHFTPAVLEALRERGVGWASVTLHVGPGTFRPVQAEDIRDHHVDPEWAELPEETARLIRACQEHGGRVVAVGTTTVRVLESAALAPGGLAGYRGWTDLTIKPPFHFRIVDALLTNFHLPRSSLLLLVAAFAGLDAVRAAYAEAVAREYRFFSYGDAMFIP